LPSVLLITACYRESIRRSRNENTSACGNTRTSHTR
jgi:hypothetical protein